MFNQKLRSLVFFHIAKTGGTSATAALREVFPVAVTSNGNLSNACWASSPAAGDPRQGDLLYHGHPEHGVAWNVPRGAITATVLREPEEHAVSSYFHLLRNPDLPLHGMAVRLGFTGLMRAHWPLLAFQAISLDVAISQTPIDTPERFFSRLPGVRRFLKRIHVVGCLDQLDTVLQAAVQRTGRAPPPVAPRLNTAAEFGVGQHEVEQLRADYRNLADAPLLRHVMAAETMLVAQAKRRGASRLGFWPLPLGGLREWRQGVSPVSI